MREQGNNDPVLCVYNLFRCRYGECFLVRDKGLDGSLIDSSAVDPAQVIFDARALIDKFEHPTRIKSTDLTIDDEGKLTIEMGAYHG